MTTFLSKLSIYIKGVFYSSAFRNVLWLFLEKAIRLPFTLLVSIYIARYLGPADFGDFSILLLLASIFSTLASLGLPSIVVKELILRPADRTNIFLTALILRFSTGLVFYPLYLVSTHYAVNTLPPSFVPSVLILGLLIPALTSEVFTWLLEAHLKFKQITLIKTILYLVFSILKLYVLMTNPTVTLLSVLIVSEAFSVFLLFALPFIKTPPLQIAHSAVLAESLTLIRQSLPLLLSALSVIVYMASDQVMISLISGSREVGFYSAANRLAELLYFPAAAIASVMYPDLLKTRRASNPMFLQRFSSFSFLLSTIALVFSVTVVLSSTLIIEMLYGTSFERSSLVLRVIASGTIFVYLNVVTSKWLLTCGQQKVVSLLTLSGAISNIILNLFLIPPLASLGAAIATVCSQILVFILPIIFLPKETNPAPHIFQSFSMAKLLRITSR